MYRRATQWRRATIIQSSRGIPYSTSRRAFDTPPCLGTGSRISCESADCLLLHIFLFYIPFYTQDPHMDLRGARRFFASCAGPRLGLQSLCLLMSLRCCLCSPSALEPRTLALPFFPALLSLSHLASAVLQPCADLAARAYCNTGVCWRIACPGTTRTPSRLPGVRPRWRRY